MPKHGTCSSIWIPIGVVGLLAVLFLLPGFRYSYLTREWEREIRQKQDPTELQAWATSLLAVYGTSNTCRLLTNTPPKGVPASDYGPRVDLFPDHVQLGWGSGHLYLWGMMIGDTNFDRGEKGLW